MQPGRKRGILCRKESCKKRSRQYNEFTELDSESIFQEYWKSADVKKQETFIQSLVDLKVKATSTVSEQSRCQHTKCYSLKKHGKLLSVCKTMFLNTLGVSERKIDSALKLDSYGVGISKVIVKPRNPHPSQGFAWLPDDQFFFNRLL